MQRWKGKGERKSKEHSGTLRQGKWKGVSEMGMRPKFWRVLTGMLSPGHCSVGTGGTAEVSEQGVTWSWRCFRKMTGTVWRIYWNEERLEVERLWQFSRQTLMNTWLSTEAVRTETRRQMKRLFRQGLAIDWFWVRNGKEYKKALRLWGSKSRGLKIWWCR